jgi:signal transduction histidine kinase
VKIPVEPLDDDEPIIAEGTGVEPLEMFVGRGTRDVAERVPPEINVAERVTLIAHDVRTPLSIIMLETQLLADQLTEEPDAAVLRSLERIAQNGAYIDRLLADLLDLASLDANQLQLRLENVDLARLLQETLDRAVSTMDRPRVKLEVRATATVNGDRNRLERVIANLISNAIKYSSATAVITIMLEQTEERARVTVIDQGIGLTPEQARTVFDRYRRAGNTRSRDGYGLGLYISRKIIDAHFGRIGVNSTPGLGSEFFFELNTI